MKVKCKKKKPKPAKGTTIINQQCSLDGGAFRSLASLLHFLPLLFCFLSFSQLVPRCAGLEQRWWSGVWWFFWQFLAEEVSQPRHSSRLRVVTSVFGSSCRVFQTASPWRGPWRGPWWGPWQQQLQFKVPSLSSSAHRESRIFIYWSIFYVFISQTGKSVCECCWECCFTGDWLTGVSQ